MQPDAVLVEMLPRLRRLARFVHRKLPGHVMLDDLVQCGLIGAWKAAQTFDGERASFSTYALRKARWEMVSFVRDKSGASRRRYYVTTESFDEERTPPSDDVDCDAYTIALARERAAALAREMHKLSARQRFVLEAFSNDVPCSETARALRVSEARVYQLRRQGLASLHDRLRAYA